MVEAVRSQHTEMGGLKKEMKYFMFLFMCSCFFSQQAAVLLYRKKASSKFDKKRKSAKINSRVNFTECPQIIQSYILHRTV